MRLKNIYKMIYPEPNKLYRHYKGGLYKVLFLSKNTETQR